MSDLQLVFEELKRLFDPHLHDLEVATDDSEQLYINTRRLDAGGKPVFFAMVKLGPKKVAFHLMPVYCEPGLLSDISDPLRKRMQGKSCFNFTKIDEAMFDELGSLCRKGFDDYQKNGKI
jgi:hypothetical protein